MSLNHLNSQLAETSQMKEIVRKLNKLEKHYGRKERQKLLKKAAKPVVKRMKANLQPKRGTGLAKSTIKAMTFRKSPDVFVGPKKTGKKDPYYLFWYEFGAPANGQPARPFIRKTFNQMKKATTALIQDLVSKSLKKYENRYAKRQ